MVYFCALKYFLAIRISTFNREKVKSSIFKIHFIVTFNTKENCPNVELLDTKFWKKSTSFLVSYDVTRRLSIAFVTALFTTNSFIIFIAFPFVRPQTYRNFQYRKILFFCSCCFNYFLHSLITNNFLKILTHPYFPNIANYGIMRSVNAIRL